jgi:hypothetical protein
MNLFDAAALLLAVVGMAGGVVVLAMAHAGLFPARTKPRPARVFTVRDNGGDDATLHGPRLIGELRRLQGRQARRRATKRTR